MGTSMARLDGTMFDMDRKHQMNKVTNFLGFCIFYAITTVLSIALLHLFDHYESIDQATKAIFRNWYFGVFGAGTYAFLFRMGD